MVTEYVRVLGIKTFLLLIMHVCGCEKRDDKDLELVCDKFATSGSMLK